MSSNVIVKVIHGPVFKKEQPKQVPALTHKSSPMFVGISEKSVWPQAMQENYIEQLKNQGFVVGARVKTKYNKTGVISGYRKVESTCTFHLHNTPNMLQLQLDGYPVVTNNHIFYNVNEVELINGESQ